MRMDSVEIIQSHIVRCIINDGQTHIFTHKQCENKIRINYFNGSNTYNMWGI